LNEKVTSTEDMSLTQLELHEQLQLQLHTVKTGAK